MKAENMVTEINNFIAGLYEDNVLGLNFGRTIRFTCKKARDKNLPDNNAAILIHLPYEEFRGKTDVGLFEFREVEKRNEVGKSNRVR